MRFSSSFAATVAGIFAQPALAQAKSETEANPLLGHLVQSVVWLALIVALLLASSYLLKRANPHTAQQKLMKTVGAHALGPRERITILELQGKWFVVGSTPSNVNLLYIVEKPDQASHSVDQNAAASGFAAQLRSLLERRTNV
jgi:flagellar protein FliO/FliZ